MPILIKNNVQIAGIRKSCELAADTLEWLEQFIKPGVTTEEINQHAEEFIRSHNALPAPLGYHGFPKATCISLNEVICHGIPSTSEVLKEGDILNIDVTTILNGYYGDTSKMFAVGQISEEAQKLLSVAKDCLDIGILTCKPGKPFFEIGKAIQAYAVSRGYSVVYQFCGHGTGISFHEEPQIDHVWNEINGEIRKMKPGMIFTVEPMICVGKPEAVIDPIDKWTARTKDGSLSAQFEHTVLVTDVGIEILTK